MMELSVLLDRLKMEHLLTQLEGVCEQTAKGDLDYQGFLAQALEAEWRGRQQRGIESRLRLARFPWLKTVEQFDFEFQPSLDRKVVRELAGMSFIERTENVVLLGPPGVGKTHLAIALGIKTVEAGYSVLFLTLESLMGRLVRARHENNKSFADWGEVFNDHVLATAILDRLLHHATTLNIKGESYRLREKKKAGLFGRRPATEPAEVPTDGAL
jgi:DNA replication protein DnaC